MIAKELVGKWIVADAVTEGLNMPTGTAFKVVGYTTYGDCIVDVGPGGWSWRVLTRSDIVLEQREFYWYLNTENITRVL